MSAMSTEPEVQEQPEVVVPLASIPESRGLVVRVHDRLRVAIFRVGDEVYAIDDVCPHQSASLGRGRLRGCVVACPSHGFLVDVTTGVCPTNELQRVRSFPTQREGDMVRVIVPPRPRRPQPAP
jgi:nitrite reductase/ring-hydroxylating ferredoxin subunit